ncbi:MAG: hypothetical protein V4616_13360 [Bacteroidota bacterium]
MKKNLIILLVLAAVASAAGYFYFNKSNKTYEKTMADFSVSDTAAIDKLIISDAEGNKIVLNRKSDRWSLNDSLEARYDLVNLLLRVFKDVVIQAPIAATAKENTIKRLAVSHRMVQIFQNGNSEPTKIWYVGDATQSHYGTTLLLETPEDGKSPDPYIVEIPWHKGYITPMFPTDYMEWMQTTLFEYPNQEFSMITVMDYREPANSFTLEKGKDRFAIKSIASGTYLQHIDSVFVRDYMNKYKAVYYEVRDHYLTPFQTDSMLASQPVYQLAVTENSGKINKLKIFLKAGGKRTMNLDEDYSSEFDEDRYYAQVNGKHVVLIQRVVFDNLLVKVSDFE